MQDSVNQHNFDKNFVNASWADMKQLLDNDIPVANKPVNKTVIGLASLLLFSIIIIGALIIKQNSVIPTVEATKEHYIYKTVYINQSHIKQDNDLIKTSFQLENKSVEGANNSIIKVNHFYHNATKTNSLYNNFESQVNYINSLPELKSIVPSLSHKSEKPELSKSNFSTNIKDSYSDKNIEYNLGLLSFISSNSNFSGYGFTTGVHLPISSKIGIQTGFAINFITRDFFVFPFLPKSSNNFKSISSLDNEETYYNGLKSFKQIYLPVNLSFEISNNFSVNSGVKFRYTYSQEIDALLESRASRNIPKSTTVENTFFSNSNIGLSFGFNYKVNPKLNLILDSEWGMSSLINKDQFKNPTNINYDLNLINLTTSFSF